MEKESAVTASVACALCDKADAKETVLQCDVCDNWYHRKCVNVDESVDARAWWCADCEEKSKAATDRVTMKDDEISCLKRELDALKAVAERALAAIREKDAEIARLSVECEQTSFSPREPLPSSTAKRISVGPDVDLSQSQIAARQAVRYELPSFSGDPEEWPIFLATFKRSSRTFGFTEDENILRLQGALRGKALRTVQGRLRHADNLEGILKALEKSYGRPDVLVNTLLDQIREAPLIRPDRLDGFIEYGDLVAEICATVKASGASERLYDATLLQELVDRMPAYLRWSWGMHSRELKRVTLTEFGAWIEKATEGAMAVTPPQLKKKTTTRQVHAHVETNSAQYSRKQACALCSKETCVAIAECPVFDQLSISQRWDKVRSLKLCKRCLGLHYGPCSSRDDCGVEGCTAKHHQKLHRVASEERIVEINHIGTQIDGTLLRYVPVKLHGARGAVYAHALLDEGSSATVMEQQLAHELGVHGTLDPLCVKYSTGEASRERNSERVVIRVSGVEENAQVYSMCDVHTIRRLSLPSQSVDAYELGRKFEYLKWIPVVSYVQASPRLLIGIDNYRLTRPLKTIEGQTGQPIATKTRLGWLIFGKRVDSENGRSMVQPEPSYHVRNCQGVNSTADSVTAAFFKVDGYGLAKYLLLSKEDQRALSVLRNNMRRLRGRFTTGLHCRIGNIMIVATRTQENSTKMDFEMCLKPIKVLGMWWDTTNDSLRYKLSPIRHLELVYKNPHNTSEGPIADMLFFVKKELQGGWCLPFDVTAEIPQEMQSKWDTSMQRLVEMESFLIPPCYQQSSSLAQPSPPLCVFVDAGADCHVAVLRFCPGCDGKEKVQLIGTRSSAAPPAHLSMPKVVQQAAVMGCRVAASKTSDYGEVNHRCYFWTNLGQDQHTPERSKRRASQKLVDVYIAHAFLVRCPFTSDNILAETIYLRTEQKNALSEDYAGEPDVEANLPERRVGYFSFDDVETPGGLSLYGK